MTANSQRTVTVVILAIGATAIGGCGVTVRRHPRVRPASPVAAAEAAHEYPSPRRSRERVSGTAPTPTAAVAAFVRGYINWDAATVSTDMRELAAHSIGQARAATQLAAAQTASDYELRRGGIANSGTIEAISPLSGGADEYVVVTRELTTATATNVYQGLQPGWHVALATVAQVAGGEWVVSGWQPES